MKLINRRLDKKTKEYIYDAIITKEEEALFNNEAKKNNTDISGVINAIVEYALKHPKKIVETYQGLNGDDFEKCVMCNKEVRIKRSVDINNRDYYVDGTGQLCKECYVEIFRKGE